MAQLATSDPTQTSTALANDAALHPRPHPLRWLSGLIVLLVLAFFVMSFARGDIDWGVVGDYLFSSEIRKGFLNTILISVLAILVGLALGTMFAVMRLSHNPVTAGVAWLYVWLFRGTPVFLQLLMWFNVALIFPTLSFPGLFHAQTIHVVTPFVAALLGLGINSGAYLTEVIRGGILSVDAGQAEAAASIGLNKRLTMFRVVLPQAMPAIIPPIGNEAIGMLKMSSLASAISFAELLTTSQQIYFINGKIMELLIVAAIWYIALTSIMSIGQYYLERKYNRSRTTRLSMADRMLQNMFGSFRRKAAA